MRAVMTGLVLLFVASCKKSGPPRYDLVGFEGEIHIVGSSSGVAATYVGPNWTIDLKIKGDNIRMESSSGHGNVSSSFFDAKKKKGYLLSPERSAYSEWDGADNRGKGGSQKPIVTRSGAHDKVLQYDCELMSIEEPGIGLRTDVCVTKGPPLSALGMMPVLMMTGGAGFFDALAEGVPLRVEIRDTESNALQAKMEATRMDQKPVADSEFVVPASYTKDK
jgi:hypothetical protein